MAIKKVYVHPDDMLEIRVVHDREETANKASWEIQSNRSRRPMLLTIRGTECVGFEDPSYTFRRESVTGEVRGYLSLTTPPAQRVEGVDTQPNESPVQVVTGEDLRKVAAMLQEIEDCPVDGEPWVIAGQARLIVEKALAVQQTAFGIARSN